MVDKYDLKKERCRRCDYMNMKIPLDQKKSNCLEIEERSNCSVYTLTTRLKERIKYEKGEVGPVIACGKDGYIDTFNCPCDINR